MGSIVNYSEPTDISITEQMSDVVAGTITVRASTGLEEEIFFTVRRCLPGTHRVEAQLELTNTTRFTIHFRRNIAERIQEAIAVYTENPGLFLREPFPTKIPPQERLPTQVA